MCFAGLVLGPKTMIGNQDRSEGRAPKSSTRSVESGRSDQGVSCCSAFMSPAPGICAAPMPGTASSVQAAATVPLVPRRRGQSAALFCGQSPRNLAHSCRKPYTGCRVSASGSLSSIVAPRKQHCLRRPGDKGVSQRSLFGSRACRCSRDSHPLGRACDLPSCLELATPAMFGPIQRNR